MSQGLSMKPAATRTGLALLAWALLSAGSGAWAAAPSKLFEEFQAICLAHPGDFEGVKAAAVARSFQSIPGDETLQLTAFGRENADGRFILSVKPSEQAADGVIPASTGTICTLTTARDGGEAGAQIAELVKVDKDSASTTDSDIYLYSRSPDGGRNLIIAGDDALATALKGPGVSMVVVSQRETTTSLSLASFRAVGSKP